MREADCALVLADHPDFDYAAIARWAALVVDTRNAMKAITAGREKIVTL